MPNPTTRQHPLAGQDDLVRPDGPRRRSAPVRRWLRPAAGVAAVVVAASVLATAGSPDVTRPRLEGSLDTAFANLYVQQQQLLGHPGVTTASMRTSSTCDRGGPTVADVGAGSDWICMVTWVDDASKSQTGKFELQVHASSCYTANGPASLVGSFTLTDTAGREVQNPVNAFDVCFDPDA